MKAELYTCVTVRQTDRRQASLPHTCSHLTAFMPLSRFFTGPFVRLVNVRRPSAGSLSFQLVFFIIISSATLSDICFIVLNPLPPQKQKKRLNKKTFIELVTYYSRERESSKGHDPGLQDHADWERWVGITVALI